MKIIYAWFLVASFHTDEGSKVSYSPPLASYADCNILYKRALPRRDTRSGGYSLPNMECLHLRVVDIQGSKGGN